MTCVIRTASGVVPQVSRSSAELDAFALELMGSEHPGLSRLKWVSAVTFLGPYGPHFVRAV